MLMGGGFGRRGPRDVEFIVDAVLLAKDAGRPVKVMWTREDDIHNGRFRPLSAHYLRAGLDSSGRMTSPGTPPCRRPRDAVLRSGALRRHKRRDGILMRARSSPATTYRSSWSSSLQGHRGAHGAAARDRFRREQIRDGSASWTSSRASVASIRCASVLSSRQESARAARWSSGWRRWRTGTRSVRAVRSGFAYIDYSGTQVAGIAEVSVDRASGQIKVHEFWCTIDCGIAVQPDNVVAQTESSIVYGLGIALSERITIKDGAVAAVEFLRLPRAAHERGSADAHRGDRDRQSRRPASGRWPRRWWRRRSAMRWRALPERGCDMRRSRRSG